MRFVLDARYVGPAPSGIGNYVRALVDRLPTLAPSDQFRFWAHPGAPAPLSRAPNACQRTVRAPANGLRTLLCPSVLDRLEPDDVVHFPSNILGAGLSCAAVATIHDVMWLDHPEYIEPHPLLRGVRRNFFGSGIRRALRQATRILTVSHASADEIVRHAPAARPRLRVTQNACEPRFRPAADPDRALVRAASLLNSDAPFFLVLGRNQPSKGHALAVRAFAGAAVAGERLVLGERQHSGRGLGRLASELGVADRIHWIGAVPEDDVIVLIQSARALLQPSLAEGFGMPALEAMACGCPVIASDIPPLREVLGGAGVYVKPGDTIDLGRALRLVADEAGRREEMRGHGLERAKLFSWERTARETLEAYREAAEEGPRR